jgi:hypothetical protein
VRDFAAVASFGILLLMTGCGGGGDATPSTAPNTPNVQAITVDPGLTNNVNLLFTTITICAPGSSNCQTIDHVLVDTGSTGLRIMSSMLSPSLSLRQQTDANGSPVTECGQFADGFTWGPVKMADVKISGELAGSVPIQVIGDPAFPVVPASCSAIGPSKSSVQALGGKGLLGLGLFQQDCGTRCVQIAARSNYYICPPSAVCQQTPISLAQQLQNPVGMFPVDNNGFIIALPSVPATGAFRASGTMTFGIGTQGNNGLGNAQVIRVDTNTGTFTTFLNQSTYTDSFMDTGSNALYFADASIPTCTSGAASDFDCPAFTRNFTATQQGTNGAISIVNFQVANANSLFAANPNAFALDNLAGPNPDPTSFDWGLPFFFGRKVFTAIDGQNTPAGPGPYLAY